MAMTKRESAMHASLAAAAKRQRERDDKLIGELRARGRLTNLLTVPGDTAVSVEQAMKDLEDMQPHQDDLERIVKFVAAFAPNAVAAAVRHVNTHPRPCQCHVDRDTCLAKTHTPESEWPAWARDTVSLTPLGEAALHHNRHYGVTDDTAIHVPHLHAPEAALCTRVECHAPYGEHCTFCGGAPCRVSRFSTMGPFPAPGTWCQCDWLGEGTPVHSMSAMCMSLRPEARRACAAQTPNGPCDLAEGHPVSPMYPGYHGHLADTSKPQPVGGHDV